MALRTKSSRRVNALLNVAVVEEVREEAKSVKSLLIRLKNPVECQPGQFMMVWVPGVREMPMSISYNQGELLEITVKEVGKGTKALLNLKRGDRVGLRGPYGRGFSLGFKRPLVVAGGIGVAPLAFLTSRLISEGLKPTVVIGAKSKKELVFVRKFKDLVGRENLYLATDDGSLGFRGTAADLAEKLIKTRDFDVVYTCGPEPMMRRVFEKAELKGVYVEASLERYVKCGVGLCGSCCIGEFRVCRDGPVLGSEHLREVLDEFGVYRRGPDGVKVKIEV